MTANPGDFIRSKNGLPHTAAAYTIDIENGKAEYIKEQLVLDGPFIRHRIPYDGAPDLYVTPGFINCHVHWVMNGDATPFMDLLEGVVKDPAKKIEAAVAHAGDTLRLGVTFGWDKGAPGVCGLPVYAGMHEAMEKGAPMTRFIHAPWGIMREGGFGAPFGRVVGSETEMDIILMEAQASGAASVKFIPETALNPQDNSYRFLMEEEFFLSAHKKAKEKNLLFAVHAKGVESLDRCIAAGVDCIEHAVQATDQQLLAFQEKDIFTGPTLYGLECRLEMAKKMNHPTGPAAYEWEAVNDMVRRASTLNGGKPFTHMLMSSDAGSFTTPHASIRELYLMRKCGFDPVSVFEAATVNGARCTRQSHMGRLRKGHAADMIFWTQNPLELSLEDWEHLEDYIAAVVLEGAVAHVN